MDAVARFSISSINGLKRGEDGILRKSARFIQQMLYNIIKYDCMAKHNVDGNNTDIWLDINRFRLEYNRDLQDEIVKNQIDHLPYQHEKFWYAWWINALWVIYSWLSLASFAEPKDEKKCSLLRERRQKRGPTYR